MQESGGIHAVQRRRMVQSGSRVWKQSLLYFCAIVTVTISQRHALRGEKLFWFLVSVYQDKKGVAVQLNLSWQAHSIKAVHIMLDQNVENQSDMAQGWHIQRTPPLPVSSNLLPSPRPCLPKFIELLQKDLPAGVKCSDHEPVEGFQILPVMCKTHEKQQFRGRKVNLGSQLQVTPLVTEHTAGSCSPHGT